MSNSRRYVPVPHMNASTDSTGEHKQTVRVGTFADGQRAVPLTATYSAEVGSFGDTEQS